MSCALTWKHTQTPGLNLIQKGKFCVMQVINGKIQYRPDPSLITGKKKKGLSDISTQASEPTGSAPADSTSMDSNDGG